MSVLFRDGPAEDRELHLRRAPMFLRVVIAPAAVKANGRPPPAAVDALDLLDDEARPDERIEVYEAVWTHGPSHWSGEDTNGRRIGGVIVSGCYKHRPDIDGELMRDNAAWASWAQVEGAERCGAVALARRPDRSRVASDTTIRSLGRAPGIVVDHPTRPPAPPAPPPDELAARRTRDDG